MNNNQKTMKRFKKKKNGKIVLSLFIFFFFLNNSSKKSSNYLKLSHIIWISKLRNKNFKRFLLFYELSTKLWNSTIFAVFVFKIFNFHFKDWFFNTSLKSNKRFSYVGLQNFQNRFSQFLFLVAYTLKVWQHFEEND